MNIFKLKAVRWVISFITIYAVMGFILIACDDCTDPGNGNGNGNGNGGKADGAEVDIPALYASTYSSISIYAVAAPENGQTVEYVINTEDVVPSSGWQNDLFFDGLKADTVYYIFARSRENSNFYAGTPNESLEVSTRDTPVETSVNISQMADVSEIILVIQTALISNNIVTIEGEYTNGDKTLELNLFESRNLIWKAVYSGNANNLILLNGKGNLEIIDGSEITAVSGTAIVFFGTNLTISGGKISAEGDDKHAISSNGNNSYVTVSGGEVSASGNKIRTIWTNGEVKISDGKVSAFGDDSIAVRAHGGIDITDGEIIAIGKGCYTIQAPTSDVNVSGGIVFAEGDDSIAIRTDARRTWMTVLTVSGGAIFAAGNRSYAIYMNNIDIFVHTGGEINGDIYPIK